MYSPPLTRWIGRDIPYQHQNFLYYHSKSLDGFTHHLDCVDGLKDNALNRRQPIIDIVYTHEVYSDEGEIHSEDGE